MKERCRIDRLLVERGFFPTREKAQAALMAGQVYLAGRRIDKAGTSVDPQAPLEVRGPAQPFASRGGLKLERALDFLGWEVTGLRALDIGASTGGFTDCLLQRGARQVVALDVGYGQLDWKLRQDPRVVVMEKINARYLTQGALGEPVDLTTVDVSFISLGLIFPVLPPLHRPGGRVVALIKPQFEAGRKQVRKGVVDDPLVHHEVLLRVLGLAAQAGLHLQGVTWSPVRGPAGNLEYLAGFGVSGEKGPQPDPEELQRVVEGGHQAVPRSVPA